MEKMHKRVNRAMEKYMPRICGMPRLYRQDGGHLLEVGVDIYNLCLQCRIEMAVVVGVGKD